MFVEVKIWKKNPPTGQLLNKLSHIHKWNTSQQEKKNELHTQNHGWLSNIVGRATKARHKRVHILAPLMGDKINPLWWN